MSVFRPHLRAKAERQPLVALGLMSGTSVDGVDVALIETDGERVLRFGPVGTWAYSEAERAAIRACFGRDRPDRSTQTAEAIVTDAHARAVESFLAEKGLAPETVDVIGFHGQTITHRPERRFTWQLGDGGGLARRVGIPVVDSLRQADVSAGGQGAPLVPVFHAALARDLPRPIAILNIGGVANVTWLGADGEVIAFDTGPGNGPLDDWIRQRTGEAYDRNGENCEKGKADNNLVEQFMKSPYFLRKPPKSLDRQDFRLNIPDHYSLADGAATIARCITRAVYAALDHFPVPPQAWVVCGGGANNPFFLRSLTDVLKVRVERADRYGWNGDALEAQAFAFLAVRSLKGLPLTYPMTTGCPAPLTGGQLHLAS